MAAASTTRPSSAVGDYTTLNDNCAIQGHSLEEGIFKADTINIGNGCTLGTAAFVHYGVRMGDNVVLEPNSFLMKGEILDPGTTWRGNPARAVSRSRCAGARRIRRAPPPRRSAVGRKELSPFHSLESWNALRPEGQRVKYYSI